MAEDVALCGSAIFHAGDEVVMLAHFKRGLLDEAADPLASNRLTDRVILKVVIGSRAYGLETEASDTDYRGVYLPPAELHWSLFGVPEQLENDAAQECFWELQKFLTLALKANPNVFEVLYSPLVEHATPLGRELIAMLFDSHRNVAVSQCADA